MKKTRIVFMGTPIFAVPTLNRLVQAGYEMLVITQPDKLVGRKQRLTPPPVKEAALAADLAIVQPEKVKTDEVLDQIAAYQPAALITVAYGQLLPKRLLAIPRVGALNVHASLLPRWRGAAPIHRAVLAGDKETGVTLMEMVPELDAGPIVGMEKTPIRMADNVGTLHNRLADIGAELLVRLLPDYLAGKIAVRKQDEEGVTYAQRIVREDEFLNLTSDVNSIFNHIRGLSPWPGATAKYDGLLIKIWSSCPYDNVVKKETGYLERVQGNVVIVQCGQGRLQLLEVQPSGKRKMTADEWFRGLSNPYASLECARKE